MIHKLKEKMAGTHGPRIHSVHPLLREESVKSCVTAGRCSRANSTTDLPSLLDVCVNDWSETLFTPGGIVSVKSMFVRLIDSVIANSAFSEQRLGSNAYRSSHIESGSNPAPFTRASQNTSTASSMLPETSDDGVHGETLSEQEQHRYRYILTSLYG